MTTLHYTLTLVSDAEPASGFGTELLNDLVPRDSTGTPVIPASHLKGLMRENFQLLAESWLNMRQANKLTDAVFGRPGNQGDDGTEAMFRLSDAKSSGNAKIIQIARTKLNNHGTAEDKSLRIAEAIAVGSTFSGTLTLDAAANAWQDLAVRLALLSVMSIGGGRNRGAGACRIESNASQEMPGSLLLQLKDIATPTFVDALEERSRKIDSGGKMLSAETVFVKLTFTATAPICCPETPATRGNNVLKSGFDIPASAVQGALLTKLDARDHTLASALFESTNFRCWPLLPVADIAQFPVLISQTHKISKLPNINGKYDFLDLFLHEKPWQEMPAAAPLKGVDGVLLTQSDLPVKLLRSADIPRLWTAHSVHNSGGEQERNLFTVESVAPTTFVGIVALPKDAVAPLVTALKTSPKVSLGKARSVRGGGELKIELMTNGFIPPRTEDRWKNRIFILQSPVVVPESLRSTGMSAESVLISIVEHSGWGIVDEASASLGVKFGWNRHKNSENRSACSTGKNRLSAVPVILPGSVFKLKTPLADTDILAKLIVGIGSLKERGYGAVLPHPGEAAKRHDPSVKNNVFPKGKDTSREGYTLWDAAKGNISPSQISALATAVAIGKGLEYLERQRTDRPKAIWDKWQPLFEQVKTQISKPKEDALAILEVWRNLAIADKTGKEDKQYE
jgi:CRISPR/Cas system CSM-associated protein Csm3 (group 7 of RAMP superfamily)